jgi:hypothetical protein
MGRFWSSPEEQDDGGTPEEADGKELSSDGDGERPCGGPTVKISLGSFIQRAEELGGSLRLGRRSAFAPGGRGSRFQALAGAPRFHRLGDSDRGTAVAGALPGGDGECLAASGPPTLALPGSGAVTGLGAGGGWRDGGPAAGSWGWRPGEAGEPSARSCL